MIRARISRAWRSIFDRILGFLAVVIVLLAIASSIVLFSLVAVHVSDLLDVQTPATWRSIADSVLFVLRVNPSDEAEYHRTISISLNATLIIVSVLSAVVPFYNMFLYRRRLRRKQSLKIYPVYTDGVDDIQVMHRYYQRAEQILVFSGDFSWLRSDELIREELLRDVSRVSFVSYKGEDAVRDALGNDLLDQVRDRFRFDCPTQMKCSLVKYGSEKVFLYKVFHPSRGKVDASVVVLLPTKDSRYLVDALDTLSKHVSELA
jgi:hypothetical protein